MLFRHSVLQGLAGLELRDAGGGDPNLLLGLGVAARAALAGLDIEAAEAYERDLLARDELRGDGVYRRGDDPLGILLGQPGLPYSLVFLLKS